MAGKCLFEERLRKATSRRESKVWARQRWVGLVMAWERRMEKLAQSSKSGTAALAKMKR
jgi:hypothetical protein